MNDREGWERDKNDRETERDMKNREGWMGACWGTRAPVR